MRAKVEVAKQNYKREKEMYRRAREERKAAEQKRQVTVGETYAPSFDLLVDHLADTVVLSRSVQDGTKNAADESVQNTPPPAPEPVSHMVSNARGPYPELEMVSVPRNHRRPSAAADSEGHFARRITRRLADVSNQLDI